MLQQSGSVARPSKRLGGSDDNSVAAPAAPLQVRSQVVLELSGCSLADPAGRLHEPAELDEFRALLHATHDRTVRPRRRVCHEKMDRVAADIDSGDSNRSGHVAAPFARFARGDEGGPWLSRPEAPPARASSRSRVPIDAGTKVRQPARTMAAATAGESAAGCRAREAAAAGKPSWGDAARPNPILGGEAATRPATRWIAIPQRAITTARAIAGGSFASDRRSIWAPISTKNAGTKNPSAMPESCNSRRVDSRRRAIIRPAPKPARSVEPPLFAATKERTTSISNVTRSWRAQPRDCDRSRDRKSTRLNS